MKKNYYFNILLIGFKGGLFIFLALYIFPLDLMFISSLASSTFAAFNLPSLAVSSNKHLIGSYLIAIAVGCLFSLTTEPIQINNINLNFYIINGLCVLVIITILKLVSLEHPPSAGIGLGFILHHWNLKTIFSVILSIIFLAIFRYVTNLKFMNIKKKTTN